MLRNPITLQLAEHATLPLAHTYHCILVLPTFLKSNAIST